MQALKATAIDAAALSTVGSVVQQLHHEQRPDWFKQVRIEELEPFYVELLEDSEARAFIAQDRLRAFFPKDGLLMRHEVGMTKILNLTIRRDE